MTIDMMPSSMVTGNLPNILSSIGEPPSSGSPRVARRRPLKWDSPVTQSGVGNIPSRRPYCTWAGTSTRQHRLKRFTVCLHGQAFHLIFYYVNQIAGDEAVHEKDQDGQYKQGGDYQQKPSDDIGSHVLNQRQLYPVTGITKCGMAESVPPSRTTMIDQPADG